MTKRIISAKHLRLKQSTSELHLRTACACSSNAVGHAV